MKKYYITLIGKGAEYYLHPINPEQKEKLSELDPKTLDYKVVTEILGYEELAYTDISFTGVFYDPELFSIMAYKDEDMENLLWESSDDFEFEDEDYEYFDFSQTLLVEDYAKGTFFSFEIETEEFDPKKLVPIIKSINDNEIITSFKYDGVDLSETKNFDDYSSKGFSYYIL